MLEVLFPPNDPPLSSPLDALWQAPAIIWTVISGMGVAALLVIAQPPGADRWVYFGLACLFIQWTVLLALTALYVVRRVLARLRPPHVAVVALLLLLLSSWFVHVTSQGLMRLVMLDSVPQGWSLSRVAGLTLCVGLLGFGAFYNHWRARQLALQAKQSQLEALQARIRPHFLFNTLNTGIALVRQQPADAERLLLDLSDLFRAALGGPGTISLADELTLTRRYAEIEQLRFGARLRIAWQIPADLPSVEVPTLSLQPLVENAIRHGIEPSADGGEIRIKAIWDPTRIFITISNSVPAERGPHASQGQQIGLSSVRARIQAMSGDRGGVDIHASQNQHVVTLRLPIVSAPKGDLA